ncbi:Peptide deformylase 1B, chloroplastic [Tetrabaena socialis]|uniref:Peptide deformylase n=1 Tax=Tetrabaena socialis TaxID=47790 RepID=A0A2J8A5N7_9CHLO|nr:Peptide deformylase 1B, chloroplastic [Tetrabaena socialis]|eukprot:PNH07846.1 Peptide deformylase 1B, chloroplastic [Tetrabaena socialis]
MVTTRAKDSGSGGNPKFPLGEVDHNRRPSRLATATYAKQRFDHDASDDSDDAVQDDSDGSDEGDGRPGPNARRLGGNKARGKGGGQQRGTQMHPGLLPCGPVLCNPFLTFPNTRTLHPAPPAAVTKLEWSSPLQIVKYPDPRLRAVNARIGVFDDSLAQLAKEMIEVMYLDDGVGLAAPQVGVNVRMMVFNPEGRDKPGNECVLVNPEVVEAAGLKEAGEEGCLSFPRIYGDVERSRQITVKAVDAKGQPVKLQLTDAWVARIFQHEYDHLQGVLFHDRMKPAVLETVRPALVALEEEFMAAQPAARIVRVPAPKVNKGFGAAKK